MTIQAAQRVRILALLRGAALVMPAALAASPALGRDCQTQAIEGNLVLVTCDREVFTLPSHPGAVGLFSPQDERKTKSFEDYSRKILENPDGRLEPSLPYPPPWPEP